MIEEIRLLAERMDKELSVNAHKGDWKLPDVLILFKEIAWHQAKLMIALKEGNREKISEHTADVCNLYLMLAHVYGCFRVKPASQALPPGGFGYTY